MHKADLIALAIPALAAVGLRIAIVLLGTQTLARWHGVSKVHAMATAGLFGAVFASTFAAVMAMLDAEEIGLEGFIGALYPFMDIAVLVTAIVLARMSEERAKAVKPMPDGTLAMTGPAGAGTPSQMSGDLIKGILVDTFRSAAISAPLLGLAIGILARPESVYDSFCEPLFRGLLSIIMGMETWSRLSEPMKVAHAYVLCAASMRPQRRSCTVC